MASTRARPARPAALSAALAVALVAAVGAIAVYPVAGARAAALSFTQPTALPKSPPAAGGMNGAEPSLAFDPSGDGHFYVAAPGGDPTTGGGVNFWASSDGGVSYPIVKNVGSKAGGGDADVEVGIDHTVYAADLEVAASAICRSTDFGKTFDSNCETGLASDHQGPEADREWITHSPKDKNVLYLTYHDFVAGTPIMLVSTDQGKSFSPCGNLVDPTGPLAGNSAGNTEVGKPVVGPDGSLYVPILAPSSPVSASATPPYGLFVVAVARGGCQSQFENHVIDPVENRAGNASLANIFPYLARDGGGTLYAAAAGQLDASTQKTVGLYVWSSHDDGRTWRDPPVSVSSHKANELPALAGGLRAGQVALGWYASDVSGDNNDPKGVWRYYAATSVDGGSTFSETTVTPSPFHYGDICTSGVACTGNRNLLDFSSIGVDPHSGCLALALPGDPYNTFENQATTPAAAYVSLENDASCATNAPTSASAPTSGASGFGGTPGAGGAGGRSPAGARGRSSCRDRTPPLSFFLARATRATRHSITLSGRSSDRGCGPRGSGRVAGVGVAVGRSLAHRRCRYLKPRGGFGPPVSCLRTSYIRVLGTTRWTLRLTRQLPRGHYIAWARAVDAAGNVERKDRRRNLISFRVR